MTQTSTWKGKRLGKFRIVDLLGRGGMGTVFLAVQEGLDRKVALKVLPEKGAGSDVRLRRRFLKEAAICSRLSHPNIVKIYDYGEEQGLLYYAMELLVAPGLDEILKQRGPLAIEETLGLATCLAEALGHYLPSGIIHRDLKPANVLVDGPRAVVTDFGLVKDLEGSSITEAHTVVGTPLYIAPELLRSERPTAGSDIYQVGVILYECLAGRVPFDGETAMDVFRKIARDEPEPLAKLRPEVPESLANLVANCLEKDPRVRYTDVEAFSRDLRAVERGLPVRLRRDAPDAARPVPPGRSDEKEDEGQSPGQRQAGDDPRLRPPSTGPGRAEERGSPAGDPARPAPAVQKLRRSRVEPGGHPPEPASPPAQVPTEPVLHGPHRPGAGPAVVALAAGILIGASGAWMKLSPTEGPAAGPGAAHAATSDDAAYELHDAVVVHSSPGRPERGDNPLDHGPGRARPERISGRAAEDEPVTARLIAAIESFDPAGRAARLDDVMRRTAAGKRDWPLLQELEEAQQSALARLSASQDPARFRPLQAGLDWPERTRRLDLLCAALQYELCQEVWGGAELLGLEALLEPTIDFEARVLLSRTGDPRVEAMRSAVQELARPGDRVSELVLNEPQADTYAIENAPASLLPSQIDILVGTRDTIRERSAFGPVTIAGGEVLLLAAVSRLASRIGFLARFRPEAVGTVPGPAAPPLAVPLLLPRSRISQGWWLIGTRLAPGALPAGRYTGDVAAHRFLEHIADRPNLRALFLIERAGPPGRPPGFPPSRE